MKFLDRELIRLGYGQFNTFTGPGMYAPVDDEMESTGQGLYHIIVNFAVYASALAIVVTFIVMMYAGHKAEIRSESKSKITRNCFIIILIFGAIEIVSLVQKIAF